MRFCIWSLIGTGLAVPAVWGAPPAAPVITEPATNGQVVHPADVHMETAPFSDPDSGDTHLCSDFEIWTVSPTQLVWQTVCIGGVEKVHSHLGDGDFLNSHAGRSELLFETEYEFRVRHRDDNLEYGPFAARRFMTGKQTAIFPMELDDILDDPLPTWKDTAGADVNLPAGAVPASLRMESPQEALILGIDGAAGIENPPTIGEHEPARIVVNAGETGADLSLPQSILTFTTDEGEEEEVFLPSMAVLEGQAKYFWISLNGSTYSATAGQVEPDFSILAQGAPVPWTLLEAGYRVEVFATGFQLPVDLAFVPNPGTNAADPLLYVAELYGTIKVVTRDGTVQDYATDLLNFSPTGNFPGTGELGLAGIAVDPANGDVLASMLYEHTPGVFYPKMVRFKSDDGGLTSPQGDVFALDRSDPERRGRFEGQPLLGQPGAGAATGTSVAFDGEDDYVNFIDAFDFGDAFSLAAWVRPDAAAPDSIQTIAANAEGGGTVDGFKLYFNSFGTDDGRVILEVSDGTVRNDAVTQTGVVSVAEQWHHVVATVDRGSGVAELYVNGIRETVDNAIAPNFMNDARWRIGQFMDGGFPVHARLDDVQVYGRILASNEVFALAQEAGSTTNALLMHLALDETNTPSFASDVLDMFGEQQGQSHQISDLSIGPDGKLYAHMGDGFDASTALDLDSFRGKILRLNLDGSAPTNNPFYDAADGTNARDYVFAYGFRNPFGGAWRGADSNLYEAENGPSVDRLAKVVAGTSYGWSGANSDMTNNAIYNWPVSHAPVAAAFVQSNLFGGSGFPPEKMDHLFVTESGPTYASGPQVNGKRISEFVLDEEGHLLSGPTPFVEYSGSGKATAAGVAAGPDGLYFTDLYKDLDFTSPIDPGANVLRVRFVGAADFAADVTAGPPPLSVQFTNTSTVLGQSGWHWDFGDSRSSTEEHPAHTFITEGFYNVALKVDAAEGISVRSQPFFVRVGENQSVLFVALSTNLGPGDAAAKSFIEETGYGPVLVKTPAEATSSDATNKAFVVISSTVLSDDVGTTFRDVPVPVLNWENFLYDDLGMSGPTAGTDYGTLGEQSRVRVTAESHFLAAGQTGVVSVVSGPQIFSWGVPNSNAVVVATLENDPGKALIFAYESNAVMPGLSAPARRLGFFLEDLTAGELAHHGEDMLEAALHWVAGNEHDADDDGLIDILDLDDDNDGMADYFEDFHGLDRVNPGDAVQDDDGDGHSNIDESRADTDPNDSNSVLKLVAPELTTEEGIRLAWPARQAVTYQLQRKGLNATAGWENVSMPLTPIEHGTVSVTNPPATEEGLLFRLDLP